MVREDVIALPYSCHRFSLLGIHGNEIVGRELLLLLSEYICKSYGHDHVIDSLVNNTRIHILPMMNPDGAADAVEGDCSSNRGRLNANGVELNEDFKGDFNFSMLLTIICPSYS